MSECSPQPQRQALSLSPAASRSRVAADQCRFSRLPDTEAVIPAPDTSSDGFQLKTDVRRRCRVSQRADRHELGAGGRQFGNAVERDAARQLHDRLMPIRSIAWRMS